RNRRGLRSRRGLRESRRREACDGCGDQKGQSGAQPAMGGLLCHQVFRISIRRGIPLPAILSCFRAKEVSFFRENRCTESTFSAVTLESALLLRDQNFALAGMIRLPDDAFEFHPL